MLRQRNISRHSRQTAATRRGGVIILEAILCVMLLTIATVAIVEFTIVMAVDQIVTASAIAGAREAAQNTDNDDVAAKVQEYLAILGLSFSTTGTNGTDDALVVIERQGSADVERGNNTIPCTAAGPNTLETNEIRVTVCFPVSNTNNRPVPNLLSTLGLDLSSHYFEVSSMSLAE